ncbi:TPA: type VI secretion system-associated protein TagO [Enterobacter ludwigii]|uniref:type VI secretion system-associated protein TagO n=1 Tax=Enterobacter ludwigii TaxID=299767 RepID=UPI0032F42CAD|nr:type VI secretion system-associated protein TagO [Enterobacter ludwigii]HDR2596140.1 type VI secretion system-associated protein TagO [Enterobacter ludwigii]
MSETGAGVMGMLTLLPLLASLTGHPADHSGLEHCQTEQDATLRLACYDALARLHHDPVKTPPRDSGYQLKTLPASGDRVLTRTVASVGALTIACRSGITQLTIQPAVPWQGETVSAGVDGIPASGNWFVREQGQRLEFARGLPAIDELRHWSGHQTLTLSGVHGLMIRLPLDGLETAIKPLRQQCRWEGP